MVSEPTLRKIRLAFAGLSQWVDLEGWQLDPMGWNYNGNQETEDTDLHLLRGESERAYITILPGDGASDEDLQSQIRSQMLAKGLISN
jgi:hypothetical protein